MGFGLLTNSSRWYQQLWFWLSLAMGASYGLLALQQAFAGEYVVQDDARQHVFWLQRFVDPALFPNDLIADYFQGVAPQGYQWLYQIAARLGIEPTLLSKVLPLGLGLITTGFCYWVTVELLPIPFAGFISAVSFSQSIWYSSEHASGTPRAFLYPLLLAFIYYVIRGQSLIYWVILLLQALFYPQIALISLGVLALRLVDWRGRKFDWATQRQAWLHFAIGFGLVAGILLYSQAQADFGAVFSRAEAIALPEFQANGRNAFFGGGFDFWLKGRSGLFHERGFTPATLIPGIVLPLLLRLPINRQWRSLISPQLSLLGQVLIVSLALFFLAHLLLFELHLPSRYTSHTFRTILGIACGMSWVIIVENMARFVTAFIARRSRHTTARSTSIFSPKKEELANGLAIGLALFVSLYPVLFFPTFPKVGYYDFSKNHKLYEYFAAQPKDSVIASLSVEASNLPMFSARTVLVSPEHAIAYHKGYYSEFRQRAEALIQAQYTTDPALLSKVTQAYNIDFWLLDAAAFQPNYVQANDWLMQYQPMANAAIQTLQAGQLPILQQSIALCTIASTDQWTVLEGSCVATVAEKVGDRPPKPGVGAPKSP
jgi:hypothetical protein